MRDGISTFQTQKIDLPYLATAPEQLPGRTRKCGLWVSPLAREITLIDTAALDEPERAFAGPDRFPENCLLVVVSPRDLDGLRRSFASCPYAPSGPFIAAEVIDAMCQRFAPERLRERIGWAR